MTLIGQQELNQIFERFNHLKIMARYLDDTGLDIVTEGSFEVLSAIAHGEVYEAQNALAGIRNAITVLPTNFLREEDEEQFIMLAEEANSWIF